MLEGLERLEIQLRRYAARLWAIIFPSGVEVWGLVAQIARVCSGPVVVVILSFALPTSDLAQWYVFAALFGMAGLLEGGASQVFGRHVAYAYGKVQSGLLSQAALASFVSYGCKLVARITPWIGVVAAIGGIFWLYLHPIHSVHTIGELPARSLLWGLYVIGGCLFIANYFLAAIASGAGLMAEAHKTGAVGSLLNAVLLALLVLGLPNLAAPVLAYLVTQALVLRVHVVALKRANLLATRGAPLELSMRRDLLRDIPKGFVLIASYQLLTAGFALLVSRYEEAATFAQFGLTLQVASVAVGLATVWSGAAFQRLAAGRSSWSLTKRRRHFVAVLVRCSLIGGVGLIGLLMVGSNILQMLAARTTMLPQGLGIPLLVMVWVEFIIAMLMQFCFSQGRMRTAAFSLGAALLTICFTYVAFENHMPLYTILLGRTAILVVTLGLPSAYAASQLLYTRDGSSPTEHE